MNIIKIENCRRIDGFSSRLEVKTNYKYNDSFNAFIVILSEEDIKNDNCLLKLRGVTISGLLIPKKYKYTFNESPIYKYVTMNLVKDFAISYY